MTIVKRPPMSEQEAKAAHLAKMDEVAKWIVDPAPPWLSQVLFDWRPYLPDGYNDRAVGAH
jgi:hypothetical protein